MTICILILQFAQTMVAIIMRMTLELALHSNKKKLQNNNNCHTKCTKIVRNIVHTYKVVELF